MKARTLESYQQSIGEIRSFESVGGVSDDDVEDQVCKVFEGLFSRHCRQVINSIEVAITDILNQQAQSTLLSTTTFSPDQRLSAAEMGLVAALAGITPAQVRTWFQNRRCRQNRRDRGFGKDLKFTRKVKALPRRARPQFITHVPKVNSEDARPTRSFSTTSTSSNSSYGTVDTDITDVTSTATSGDVNVVDYSKINVSFKTGCMTVPAQYINNIPPSTLEFALHFYTPVDYPTKYTTGEALDTLLATASPQVDLSPLADELPAVGPANDFPINLPVNNEEIDVFAQLEAFLATQDLAPLDAKAMEDAKLWDEMMATAAQSEGHEKWW
ncbi:hypothetical protein IAR55_002616 [Kwoniella newhampshirensis]|uniref:Homeobox domain-containing protein n=1 Tax=Kwoniella newhampshirensis TaxID=1651941 RepID=A0AAW0YZ51_9TREE